MGRKVSVGLELDVAGFIVPAESAKKVTGDLDDKVDALDRSLNKIPADAAKAGAAMKLLGGDVNAVGEKVSSLGDKNAGLAVLDAKIRSSRMEVKKLADEFVKTGGIDVFKRLGDAEGRLRALQGIRAKLKDALVINPGEAKGLFGSLIAGAKDAGTEVGKIFGSGVSGSLSTPVLGPALIALAVPAVMALGTFIGAAIGGAITLAGGAAGAGLGLAGAWMGDPVKYGAMWNKSVDGIQKRWKESSAAFGNELETSLKVVDRMLQNLPVEKLLAVSQSLVVPLATGAGSGVTELADGFADLVAMSEPFLEKIGPAFGNLGHDLGDTFRAIGYGAAGGTDALEDLIAALGYVAKAAGVMIMGLEMTYGALKGFRAGVGEAFDGILGRGYSAAADNALKSLVGIHETGIQSARVLGEVSDASDGTATSLAKMATEAANAAAEQQNLTDALTRARSAALGASNANLALAQGWLDLKKELAEGKATLDLSSQAGINHAKALQSQVENAEAARQKQIQLTGDVAAADAVYAANIERIRQMAYAAGLNHQKVDELIDSLKAVPPVTASSVKVDGLSTALAQGVSLGAALRNIDGKVATANVYVYYHQQGQSQNAPLAQGGMRRAAVGMIIPPSDPGTTLVGEPQTGGEALIPFQGISQGRAMSLMQQVGSGYGLNVSAGAGGGMPRELVLHATFVDPMTGDVMRRTAIRWSLDRGRSPADFFTKA